VTKHVDGLNANLTPGPFCDEKQAMERELTLALKLCKKGFSVRAGEKTLDQTLNDAHKIGLCSCGDRRRNIDCWEFDAQGAITVHQFLIAKLIAQN
jgi:hypothetical protein